MGGGGGFGFWGCGTGFIGGEAGLATFFCCEFVSFAPTQWTNKRMRKTMRVRVICRFGDANLLQKGDLQRCEGVGFVEGLACFWKSPWEQDWFRRLCGDFDFKLLDFNENRLDSSAMAHFKSHSHDDTIAE